MENTSKQHFIRGTVEKISGPHTIRVVTKVTKVHPLYRKRYSQLRHYLVHDLDMTAQIGEEVAIVMTRPISKHKHWTLLKK